MNDSFVKILPPIFIFLFGYILKKVKIFKKEDADLFLKVVFFAAAPALYIQSLSSFRLEKNFIYIPLILIMVIVAIYAVSFLIGNILNIPKKTFGVFLTSTMIMNTGFVLPFFISSYGEKPENLVSFFLFDAVNVLVVFSFIYFIACMYGNKKQDIKLIAKKILFAPPIWAVIIGLILHNTGISFPLVIKNSLQLIAGLTVPLTMLALGVYLNVKLVNIKLVFLTMVIRYGVGFLLGLFFVSLFKLEGIVRTTIIIGSAAPVGTMTLMFSSLENLDTEFAASLVSLSLVAGLVIIPTLILFIK